MFEDIVKTKFEDVDLGEREIAPEIRAQLWKGLDYGLGQMDAQEEAEELDPELKEMINSYFDQNVDAMCEMYMEAFTPEELIEMLDFEQTPLARKRMEMHFKMQKFVIDGLSDFMMKTMFEKEEEEEEKYNWEALRNDISKMGEEIKEEQTFIWDAKE